MVRAIRDGGRQPILLNVPYANESMFPLPSPRDLHRMRDYHNERLTSYCQDNQFPLVDIASKLHDEHFGDELHPNEAGAKVIATGSLPGAERGAKDGGHRRPLMTDNIQHSLVTDLPLRSLSPWEPP